MARKTFRLVQAYEPNKNSILSMGVTLKTSPNGLEDALRHGHPLETMNANTVVAAVQTILAGQHSLALFHHDRHTPMNPNELHAALTENVWIDIFDQQLNEPWYSIIQYQD